MTEIEEILEKLIHSIAAMTCLFAVEGTTATSMVSLNDGTDKFLDKLTEDPIWSRTRYADIIRVIQDGNMEILPPYLKSLITKTIEEINSLWQVPSAQS